MLAVELFKIIISPRATWGNVNGFGAKMGSKGGNCYVSSQPYISTKRDYGIRVIL